VNAIPAHGQFPAGDNVLPRFREAGDVTLDLFHRDGRVDDCWLALPPREFALLWRLAETPGEPLSRQQWQADVWPAHPDPEGSSLGLHVARVRARLEPFGLAGLIVTDSDGGCFLDAPPAAGLRVLARRSAG